MGDKKNNRHPKKLKIIEDMGFQKKNIKDNPVLIVKTESESI